MAIFRSSKVIRDLLTTIDTGVLGVDTSIDNVEESLTLVPEADIHMQAVTANTDILADDINPGVACVLMVQASFDTNGAFFYLVTQDGASTPQIQFNDGLDLYMNNGYMFDIAIGPDSTVNFQHAQTCVCNLLTVMRVYIR